MVNQKGGLLRMFRFSILHNINYSAKIKNNKKR